MNPKTVERELAKGNGFIDEREIAETYRDDVVVESIYKKIMAGNANAGFRWLEAKRPSEWAPKKEPLPGSSPATPLHVAPGVIDWDRLPEELSEEFLAVHPPEAGSWSTRTGRQ